MIFDTIVLGSFGMSKWLHFRVVGTFVQAMRLGGCPGLEAREMGEMGEMGGTRNGRMWGKLAMLRSIWNSSEKQAKSWSWPRWTEAQWVVWPRKGLSPLWPLQLIPDPSTERMKSGWLWWRHNPSKNHRLDGDWNLSNPAHWHPKCEQIQASCGSQWFQKGVGILCQSSRQKQAQEGLGAKTCLSRCILKHHSSWEDPFCTRTENSHLREIWSWKSRRQVAQCSGTGAMRFARRRKLPLFQLPRSDSVCIDYSEFQLGHPSMLLAMHLHEAFATKTEIQDGNMSFHIVSMSLFSISVQ